MAGIYHRQGYAAAHRRAHPSISIIRSILTPPTTRTMGSEMLEDEKRRFTEALEHWATMLDDLRARERAEAVARAEELGKVHLRRIFHASDLCKHHARKHRSWS
jgi:hypothetical protein